VNRNPYAKPHPYWQHATRTGCHWCDSYRNHRRHQPLIWRITHPLATWR
jgi:hypothetical protein